MNTTLVSIILCTYNRAQLLTRALRSVQRQTYSDWEIRVIDDGSTDDTVSIVKGFSKKDSRIHYFYQKNHGLASARNTGVKRSKGTMITFIDSDDEYTPDHLEQRMVYMAKNPMVDMIHGGTKFIGPKSKQYVVDVDNPSKKIHLSRCHIGGTYFLKAHVFRKVRGFRPIPFGEDYDFFKRVEKYFTIRKVAYRTYRYHLETDDRLCDIFTEALQRK